MTQPLRSNFYPNNKNEMIKEFIDLMIISNKVSTSDALCILRKYEVISKRVTKINVTLQKFKMYGFCRLTIQNWKHDTLLRIAVYEDELEQIMEVLNSETNPNPTEPAQV